MGILLAEATRIEPNHQFFESHSFVSKVAELLTKDS
jgi:hypothetical protein